ncbi:ATP-binding cassette domain-containing protein [Demetria terragena]|uniref:ATP-binding cassette domain-containing protein n=1 Tax=Demetria terragena TaxID=63959 RepID=UPI001FDFFCAC|nr:ABC transporter ATP-binding protein [Demetria terragena]
MTWNPPERGRTLLLGRNGAGKTTTLRTMSGSLRPRAGRILLNGKRAKPIDLRRTVALMPQGIVEVPGLTVVQQVAFAGWLAGRSAQGAQSAALKSLELTDLFHLRDRDPKKLSGGELRRLGLAEALARPAQMLLLDEPTAGLDPLQRAKFRETLMSINHPTVVSTHQLDDVYDVYDAVAVLDRCRIVFAGTMDEFLSNGHGTGVAQLAESAFGILTESAQ